MSELVLEVRAFYDTSMVRNLRMQITHDQLAKVLSELAQDENPLKIEADELLDYVSNEGQAASFVKLSGRREDMERMLDLIAHRACYLHDVKSEHLSTYKLDDGDIEFATCVSRSTI